MPKPRRFHRTPRFNEKFADAPLETHQTISNPLYMLEQGLEEKAPPEPAPEVQPQPPAPIIKTSPAKAMGFPEGMIVALGDVMIRYKIPVEYPTYVILLDLLWT